MTNNFLIVSFFTINTPYENEADVLINSLDKFDLPFHVEGVSNKYHPYLLSLAHLHIVTIDRREGREDQEGGG